MKRIKLIILESDGAFAQALKSYFARENYDVCGVSADGKEGLALAEQYKPDVMVASASLAGLDGYTVMENVKRRALARVVIALCERNDRAVNRAYAAKADHCITVPATAATVGAAVAEYAAVFSESGNIWEFLDGRITEILVHIGARHKLAGFGYLRAAIRISVLDPLVGRNITGKLYPAVAEEFGAGKFKVERGIRTVIDTAWESGKLSELNALFGYECIGNRKPTNGELISMIADRLLQEAKAKKYVG